MRGGAGGFDGGEDGGCWSGGSGHGGSVGEDRASGVRGGKGSVG